MHPVLSTKRLLLIVLILGLLGTTHTTFAQSPPLVSILTFQPGTVYWQRFGHNAILVRRNEQDIVYNYGIFDFNQENFMLNFAAGKMQYRLDAQPLLRALYPYQVEGRWAVEQQLDLSPDQATQMADYLAWNALPENAEYHYDYFIENCSTKVRDVINQTLSGQLEAQLKDDPATLSYRDQVARVSAPDLALMLGMDVGLGPPADKNISVWEESFIPGVLMRALRDVKLADGTPLVRKERTMLQGTLPPEPDSPPVLWLVFLVIGLAVSAIILLLEKARANVAARIGLGLFTTMLALVFGLGGLALAGLWGLTAHWGTYNNQNLLLLNPMALLLLPLWLSAMRQRWRMGAFSIGVLRLITLGAAITPLLHLLPGITQGNVHWIALLLPVHLSLLWVVEDVARAPKTVQQK